MINTMNEIYRTNEIYFDNSATTKCYPEVATLMKKIMCEDYGNAASMHRKGVQAEKHIRYAREVIATHLKTNEKEIIFTSGGTEANNLAIIGAASANKRAGRHLITTTIEHPAISRTMKYLEQEGFRVTYLPVDKNGVISISDLEQAINRDTILVSIMHTNNEIGSIQPIAEAGALLMKKNPQIIFHVDAVQGFGKNQIYPQRLGIGLLTVSGHKIHGPKGVGFLYADEKIKLNPTSFGGNQQRGKRSGTENVPGIAGMAKAIEMQMPTITEDVSRLHELKDHFVNGLMGIPQITINSPTGLNSAPHIVNASFIGIKSEVLLHTLEEKNIYVSAGSACAANKINYQSATLKAIGLNNVMMESAIRFSFSHYTTKEEIDYTLQTLYDIIPMLRKYVRK